MLCGNHPSSTKQVAFNRGEFMMLLINQLFLDCLVIARWDVLLYANFFFWLMDSSHNTVAYDHLNV